MATTINPAALNALVFDYGRKKANLDDQENRYRINYNTTLRKMQENYEDVEGKNRTGFSDRGMLHSGASIKNQMDLKKDDLQNRADLSQDLNTNLATIARQRLEADQEFETQKLLATLGLTSTTSS